MDEARPVSRRGFVVWAVGGLISLGMGIPAIAYIIGPALQRSSTQNWIRLGSTAKVELGTPTLFKAKIQRQAGWIVNEEELSVYVLTDNGRDLSRDVLHAVVSVIRCGDVVDGK